MNDESSTTSSASGTDTAGDPPSAPETAGGDDDPDTARDAGSGPASDRAGAQATGSRTGPVETAGRREVVVPPRLYKTVTVFSTLLAVGAVVGGFVLIDEATGRATRRLAEVNVPLAALGLGLIVGGAVQYAYAQRFRAGGMATDKSDGDRGQDDG